MEEDIKNLLEITNLCKEEIENNDKNITAILDFEDLKSLRNMLKRYKELEEENKELRMDNINSLCEECSELAKEAGITEEDTKKILKDYRDKVENSIPISVIQNTLKEIDNRNYNDYTNNQDGNEVKNNILKDIQELLEERNK